MRSLVSTFVLALIAAAFCALAAWQWSQGNFDSLFGAPPTPVGQRIYTSFRPEAVKFIRISASNSSASFALRENGWQASTPWADRMDPRAAASIINFTLGLRVEDHAPDDQVSPQKSGLNERAITIRLEDANHAPLAKYKLGRPTPWKAEVEGIEQAVPTVFIQPRDLYHRHHVYVCTGDITPLFNDDLKFLRDHHPFFFNPANLREIRIRAHQGDLTLGRESPQSAWRIVKPLDLATDPAAMKSLRDGLLALQAVKISDRSAVTPPVNDTAVKSTQIAVRSFDSDTETLLEITPPESVEAHDAKATVSDRPNTVFALPLKPEPGFTSLADLPLTVNDLRDPTLSHLNPASLLGIVIQPSTGAPTILTRSEPNKPWQITIDDIPREANQENFDALLKIVTTSRATGFVSDAATDFTPWGLNRPFLTLRFLGMDRKTLELRFGMDGKGGVFVNRLGSPTVMRVDPAIVATIAVQPYQWRHARLWSLDRFNLNFIERKAAGASPLVLKYNFIDESWIAERDGKDISDTLDPARANYMLSVLEGLKVSRWLATTDEAAHTALANPSFTLTVVEKKRDDEDKLTAVAIRTLTLAPATADKNPARYFGRLSTETHPFMINRGTYQKLAADLFEK